MKINKEILLKVAKNARLDLNDEEVKELLPQIEEVLEHFSNLDKIDTNKVKPSFQPIEIKNVFRKDKSGMCLTQDEILKNVKNKKDGFFKGPKTI
ncbi:Asp-tRNA(Asn)/Glu-tRNA(Gln) amidotransferase GatCAB subunit C [archaeon]|nr:Asp-tRNA(Asn)/Glu-tRNA(Gln) amidotransferase GatCAB subunit C [archaeon]|tara:strand:+ start:447 stop:731 length:285 start_codon:yes stop_codon:yes gene_type:complete